MKDMGGPVYSFGPVLHFYPWVCNITGLEVVTKPWSSPQLSRQWRSSFSFEDSYPHDVNSCSAAQAEVTL